MFCTDNSWEGSGKLFSASYTSQCAIHYIPLHMRHLCQVGPKKAREMWFLARFYTAAEAEKMGLVNTVIPVYFPHLLCYSLVLLFFILMHCFRSCFCLDL